jgi:hypothetical protein
LFDIDLVKCTTASSLASQIFFKKYYNFKTSPLPLIKDPHIFRDIKEAYYGGRVEVYRPVIETNSSGDTPILRYVDVNSLYPAASLNDMPGLICVYMIYAAEKVNLDELFGFFYCKVKCDSKRYLGLLPKKPDCGLIFPSGE